MNDSEMRSEMRRLTRRSLFTGAAAALLGTGAWEWLRTRRDDDEEPWPLRIGLRVDEQLSRDYFDDRRLARTYGLQDVQPGRPNGTEGMEGPPPENWSLKVSGFLNSGDDLTVTMEQIRALPKSEIITELKCIEGWRRIIRWGGVRFRDFVAKFGEGDFDDDAYIGMATADEGYYVGLDMPSAMHPQTLLAYEMNGGPLTPEYGAPLRLAISVKYGIKNIKRIGTIRYQTTRPRDFWAEEGYDWYAGF